MVKWLTCHHITDLEFSKSDCIFTFTSILSYVFILLIRIFSFQLEELLLAFLVRQI